LQENLLKGGINMIIGLSGKTQVGKDTVAKIIQYLFWEKKHNLNNLNEFQTCEYWIKTGFIQGWGDINHLGWAGSDWEIRKFAYAVKQICSILTGIPIEDFEKEEVKNSYLDLHWQRFQVVDTHNRIQTVKCVTYQEACDYKESQIRYLPYLDLKVQPYAITVRELLQKVGTDVMRDVIHPDVWVNALMRQYEKPAARAIRETGGYCNDPNPVKFPNWIISDVRFPNEAKAIKDRQGIVIRVHRENPLIKIAGDGDKKAEEYVRNKFKAIESKLEHTSETALDNYKFDYVIENDSNIPSLIEKVKEMLIRFKLL
jgi:hypothetical protein